MNKATVWCSSYTPTPPIDLPIVVYEYEPNQCPYYDSSEVLDFAKKTFRRYAREQGLEFWITLVRNPTIRPRGWITRFDVEAYPPDQDKPIYKGTFVVELDIGETND
jgi:hypothetical protein